VVFKGRRQLNLNVDLRFIQKRMNQLSMKNFWEAASSLVNKKEFFYQKKQID